MKNFFIKKWSDLFIYLLKTVREWFENGSRMVRQMCAAWAMLRGKLVNCAKSLMQIFAESLKSLKSLMQIFATYATYASANFVGKESNESTVRYALWSRISLIKPLQNPYLTLTRFPLSLGSNLSRSRSACAPRTPSLFKDKSQLSFPSLASLICLCMLTVGVGNVWGANQTYTLVSDLSTLTSSDKVLIVSSDGSSNYYALKNNQVTSAANLGETSVTISSNTITADLDADYTWYLEYKDNETIGGSSYRRYYIKSTKGTYYLQNAGATGSIINSKSATELQNVWVIGYTGSASIKVNKVTSTYYTTGLYNRGNSRMLAHVSSDWRCYASTNWNNLSNRVVQIYKKASSCAKTVTPAEGTKTNVSAMTFSSASVATCSETAADRQVTVTITPSSCYSVPSSTRLSVTGTSADYVSGPTDNGNGTYSFVYRFAKDATGTSTFSASLSTKTTYTVQYNAGATTCTGGNAITGSHADDTKTCGTNLTLPGETFHATGYTQTGWTKSSCGSQTNGLGGSYTSNAEQTFYPVWTVNSYTVTWMVNGEEYTAGGSTSVNYGSHVATLPTAPTPSCGDKFMGWTTTNIGSVGQATDAGLNLFTTAGGAPIISAEGPVTYYAVFADYAE